ncbi:IclR family transcriptional regulator [Spiractinospora alimapuensis]|uniref:IclR family transcriptional regulator n=1 Tax=Spiractinospora alimapuensis TaxID=2820884 RepID=UPI001F1A9CAA|nr:IclR family transcriptional regulator [Spiractinospora alimapuensis]QVQ51859.1 IclR family transcriptional regulator [Spiractinospora alimapuensis]
MSEHGVSPGAIDEASKESKNGRARNLVRAFTLLDALASDQRGLPLAELARGTGVPEATAHRLLHVLADLNVVRVGDNGRWRVGRHCLELGVAYLESVELRSEARGTLQRLNDETGETCALGVLDDDRVVYVDKIDSPLPVRTNSRLGRSNPATTTALGRAILAWSPAPDVEAILTEPIPQRTERTIVDPAALREELRRCQTRGYSVDIAENEEGINGVGAPIIDYRGAVVGAISVAGPASRLTEDDVARVGAMVAEATTELSHTLGFSPRVRDAVQARTQA